MKISNVEVLILRLPKVLRVSDGTQDCCVIRIETDTGLIGIGEADSMPSVVKSIYDAKASNSIGRGLKDLLKGQDPLQIEPLLKLMKEGTQYLGSSGVSLSAISGAEIALWDLAGKASGKPIYELMGGKFRNKIKVYASVLFPEDSHDFESVRTTAEKLRKAGSGAMKFGWGGFGSEKGADLKLVEAARLGAGEDVDLMIDVGFRWDLPTAIDRVAALAKYNLFWLEAPMPFEPADSYAQLCSRSNIRIACEVPGGLEESIHFLQRSKLHVILPDASNIGGLSQWKLLAQQASRQGAWCVPHNYSSSILTVASAHLMANQPNINLLEFSESGSELSRGLVMPALAQVDGYITVPNSPGLGVTLNMDTVAKYLVI